MQSRSRRMFRTLPRGPFPAGPVAAAVLLLLPPLLGSGGCDSAASPDDPCTGVTCSFHGVCISDGVSPFCSCLRGYHPVGLACIPNNPDDPCDGVDCNGHGGCRVESDLPVCDCDPDYRTDDSRLLCLPVGGPDADADLPDAPPDDGDFPDVLPDVTDTETDASEVGPDSLDAADVPPDSPSDEPDAPPSDGPTDGVDEAPACAPHDHTRCIGDDVVWFDSCGTMQEVAEACGAAAVCREISAVEATCCTLDQRLACDPGDNDVHSFDSCGIETHVAADCADPNGECRAISAAAAVCGCRNRWEGEGCDVCPTRWDPRSDCASCIHHWSGADCSICPPYWDPTRDCNACIGRYLPDMDCSACAVYVDAAAPAGGTGMTWATAIRGLQAGIDAGQLSGCEVWVKRGSYVAYSSSTLDTFQLRPGVAVYGGFAGTETRRDARNSTANVTILEGQNGSNFVEHVVTGADGAILDGFTVQHGRSLNCATGHLCGGAGFIQTGSGTVTLSNIRFFDNQVRLTPDCASGGAIIIFNYVGTRLIVEDSTFEQNRSGASGGAIALLGSNHALEVRRSTFRNNSAYCDMDTRGGAISVGNALSVLIEDSTFSSNAASGTTTYGHPQGGAVHVARGLVTVRRSSFVSNGASPRGRGGALYITPAAGSIIESSLFRGNSAAPSGPGWGDGGGLYCTTCGNLAIVNSTFYANSGLTGTAIWASGSPILRNSIVWSNSLYGVSGTISYTDLSPGLLGTGNIEADPRFVNPAGGDFRLQADSPCIDAANGPEAPETDRDGAPRVDAPATPNTGVGPPWADMGAWEFQP